MSVDEAARKSAAASVGAVITSLVVTPLEVVKTRLQVQAPEVLHVTPVVQKVLSSKRMLPSSTNSSHYCFYNGLMDTMLPKQELLQRCKCTKGELCPAPPNRNGLLPAMIRIVQKEGPTALYAGLPPTLLISIPSTAMYFTSYEMILQRWKRLFPEQHHGILAMASGSMARSITAALFSPLELIRVQMQAIEHNSEGFITHFRRAVAGNPRHLFAGLGPTLARDIPFSAVYWYGIEESKVILNDRLEMQNENRKRVLIAFLAGITSGSVATILTHPFDVVKTRAQSQKYARDGESRMGMMDALRQIHRSEGSSALTAGVAPRVLKTATSCAIMISTYEATKILLQ